MYAIGISTVVCMYIYIYTYKHKHDVMCDSVMFYYSIIDYGMCDPIIPCYIIL